MFNQINKEAIVSYINSYADSKNLITPADIPNILYEWQESKKDFLYPLLGNQLIIKKEIHYKASIEQMQKRFNKDCSSEKDTVKCFMAKLENLKCKLFPYPEVSTLFDENVEEIYNDRILYSNYISNSFLLAVENKYPSTTPLNIPLPNGKHLKVQKGTKITRVWQKLANAYNIPKWEIVREYHAKFVSDTHFDGTLCLSIHPLDYMTMSDNDEGWDSCMSWAKEGEYRAGTIEMMNSPYALMAYIENKNKTLCVDYCQKLTWNSKIWRELFIVNKDICTNVKGYPFTNPELEKIVLSWIKELAEKNLGISYNEKLQIFNSEENNENTLGFTPYFVTNFMYNDTGRVTNYCYVSEALLNENPTSYEINYSGSFTCICCGKQANYLNNENQVCCNCCHNYNTETCICCGTTIDPDNDYYVIVNGEYYCEDCKYYNLIYAADTEEYYLADDVIAIYKADDEDVDEDGEVNFSNAQCAYVHDIDSCYRTFGAQPNDILYDENNNIYYIFDSQVKRNIQVFG